MYGDIELNSELPELLNILHQKENHIFHQNIQGLFSKKNFTKIFIKLNKIDLDVMGFAFISKPRH